MIYAHSASAAVERAQTELGNIATLYCDVDRHCAPIIRECELLTKNTYRTTLYIAFCWFYGNKNGRFFSLIRSLNKVRDKFMHLTLVLSCTLTLKLVTDIIIGKSIQCWAGWVGRFVNLSVHNNIVVRPITNKHTDRVEDF